MVSSKFLNSAALGAPDRWQPRASVDGLDRKTGGIRLVKRNGPGRDSASLENMGLGPVDCHRPGPPASCGMAMKFAGTGH
jgi:hypothetical protein